MIGQQVQFAAWFELETCSACAIQYYVPAAFSRQRHTDGKGFYCPNGHSQFYAETEVSRLKKQLEQEKRLREAAEAAQARARSAAQFAENSARTLRGHLTRERKRVAAGVCPCCRRSFSNLRRHMTAQHPDHGRQP